jgi:hypothetical protein
MSKTRTCKYCGRPTGDREFYPLPSGRVWAHLDCMEKAGKRLIERGAADARYSIAVNFPDAPAKIKTGRRLREKK